MTTGINLAVSRLRARLTQQVLSYYLGISRGRISHIEAQARVTPACAARYRAALQAARHQV